MLVVDEASDISVRIFALPARFGTRSAGWTFLVALGMVTGLSHFAKRKKKEKNRDELVRSQERSPLTLTFRCLQQSHFSAFVMMLSPLQTTVSFSRSGSVWTFTFQNTPSRYYPSSLDNGRPDQSSLLFQAPFRNPPLDAVLPPGQSICLYVMDSWWEDKAHNGRF